MVAITGQVPRRMIGTDAFQETPTVEITRQITKHNYLVMNVEDIPRVVREAFFLASSGRPGPVLIDIPKDVQQLMSVPYWGPKVSLNGYLSRLPNPPTNPQMQQVLDMLKNSKRPVRISQSPHSASLIAHTRLTFLFYRIRWSTRAAGAWTRLPN
jgi:acetolactate synthase-1/2/3 large subunit